MTKEGGNKKAIKEVKVEKPSESAFRNKALAGLFQPKAKPAVPAAPKPESSTAPQIVPSAKPVKAELKPEDKQKEIMQI